MSTGEDAVREQFDHVVIGGGSAGCVLAHRLSRDPSRRVLLVEAGPDTPPDAVPASIYAEGYLPDYFSADRYWTDLTVYRDPVGNRDETQVTAELRAHRYEQARVMGGGSSVNGQVALRGLPSDYDGWVELGARGWSFEECLPYFRRLERDLDFDGPLHGREGPIGIRRTFPEQWPRFALAFRDSLARRGIPYADDCHAEFGIGCFPFPKNNVYGRRITTAVGYLDSATRRCPNLEIRPLTRLKALLFDEGRVTGVTLVDGGGGTYSVAAGETILAAGALHTPAILMRAGIGPGEHLAAMGLPVRADRPGVGANLQDHPLVGLGVQLRPEARLDPSIQNSFLVYTRFSSGLEGCPPGDMKMSLAARFDQTPIGHRFGALRVGPDKVFSRGTLRLRSPDPDAEPFVSFNLLSDARDLVRMRQGVRFAIELARSSEIAAESHAAFAGAYTDWIRRLGRKSPVNRAINRLGALALDAGGGVRRLLTSLAMSGYDMERMRVDDAELDRFIGETVLGNWHACGTVRMGDPEDRMAGVDPEGRVLGVGGLRVADASTIPSIPCANINLTTIMIAEKMSDHIRVV